jgi:LuxR family maltose regulon positive regulatory protein
VYQIEAGNKPVSGADLMPATLLATKLSVPTISKYLVDRPRLLTKLDECLSNGCRLALISAPAGFGKTALVSAWVARLNPVDCQPAPSVAWVSLDPRDNNPLIFWSYLLSALQNQRQEIGNQSLGMLKMATPPDLEGLLAVLINDLAGSPNPFCLILDDYHLIRNPAIHQSLAFFLDHLPSQFHLIVLSRTDPPLPLALLRSRGQLAEIRINDLRFSVLEADAFLNDCWRLNLALQAVKTLQDKIEGWAAGLQMAALSLQEAAAGRDQERIENFIASFSGSNRYILDYLVEEVLNQQPVEIQNFLLRTSILDRMCAPLCDALVHNGGPGSSPESQVILEHLEVCNLFIFPLDDQRCWYRYHPLFADLLRKRLNQMEAGIVPELHQRAIQWYEQNEAIPKAVEHAFLIKDFPKAAFLINQIAEELWGRGEYVTLLAWMDALPDDEKRKYPQLWVYQVSTLITEGKIEQAERRVLEIENYLGSTTEIEVNQASIMGKVYSLRTYVASFHQDIPNLLLYSRLALENLTGEKDAGGRCGIFMVLSNAYLNNGDVEAAAQALTQAIEAGRTSHRHYMVLTAMANLATVLITQGRLGRAGQVCQEGLELIQQSELNRSPMAANLLIAKGLILCERHELDEAGKIIQEGLDLARERCYIWSIAWGYRALMRFLLACNDLSAAEAVIMKAEQLATQNDIPDYHLCGISGFKGIIWVRMGKTDQAEAYLRQRQIRVDGEIHYPHESEYWALARMCLAKRDFESGADLLERLLLRAEVGKQALWSIRFLALQAMFYQAQGRRDQGLHALDRALAVGEPERCVQTFVDEGQPMQRLLAEAVRQGMHTEYALRLLQAFNENAPGDAHSFGGAVQTRKREPLEPLSKRELEIIRLIAAGCSNKEIAQKLYISLRTVKYHTTSIYTKLEVTGRAQAAVKAKELGLLQ